MRLLLAGVAWQFDDPTRHARDALRAALLGYAGFHGVVTLMLALRSLADVRQGRTSAMRRGAAPVWQLFQAFWLGTSALSLGVVALQEIG